MRRRILLHIKDVEDLSRDILKSETDTAEDGSGVDNVNINQGKWRLRVGFVKFTSSSQSARTVVVDDQIRVL
jgi:hypothetical protein